MQIEQGLVQQSWYLPEICGERDLLLGRICDILRAHTHLVTLLVQATTVRPRSPESVNEFHRLTDEVRTSLAEVRLARQAYFEHKRDHGC
jgi:hypothetical protein